MNLSWIQSFVAPSVHDLFTHSNTVNAWLSDLVSDCTADELKLISDTAIAMRESMRRLKQTK